MNSQDRQIRRMLVLAQSRPEPPLAVTLTGSRLSWEAPPLSQGITHYLIRVGSDAGSPRYKVPVGQTSCVLAGGDSSFWVSSYNEATEAESARVHVSGTAAGAGSGDSIRNISNFAAVAENASEGVLRITLTGDLPTDSLLQGLAFVIEAPQAADPAPANPTLPGVIQMDAHEWYCQGDGTHFSISFEAGKPDRNEKWIIYALSFGARAANYLKRLTQISPPLPADATPYAVIDLADVLTLPGSGLGDVTITGTPALTPTGYGTLKIDLLYVPPYVSGPVVSIGDFQGVTPYVEYADGSVKSLPDQPYLANPLATPPNNLGSVSLSIPMPSPQTIYVQLCSYSTTARLAYKPHATAPSQRWVAIVIDSSTASGGMATQVGAFAVAVEQQTLAGVDAGGKQGRFKVTFTPPVDSKWKSALLERIACDSLYTPLPGAAWGRLTETTVSPEYFGWWPWPTVTEYWRFRARSVNFEDVPNDTAYPQVLLTLNGDGTLVLSNNAIAASMLQDLAVTARAMADYVISDPRMFTPSVIGNAAIGLAAIHNANIYDLSVDKITVPAAGAVMIQAGGTFTLNGAGGDFKISATGVESNVGAIFNGAVQVNALLVGLLAASITNTGDATLRSLALTTALSVANGGTGATDAAAARTNLSAAAASHTHTISGISDWPTPALDGTYANPTSITISHGIITAIS